MMYFLHGNRTVSWKMGRDYKICLEFTVLIPSVAYSGVRDTADCDELSLIKNVEEALRLCT